MTYADYADHYRAEHRRRAAETTSGGRGAQDEADVRGGGEEEERGWETFYDETSGKSFQYNQSTDQTRWLAKGAKKGRGAGGKTATKSQGARGGGGGGMAGWETAFDETHQQW